MQLTNLTHPSYWFAIITPPFKTVSFYITLGCLIALALSGIVLRIVAKRMKENPPLSRGLFRLARPLFFVSLLGIIFFAFRQMGAAVLSARVWLLVISLIAVVWFVMVLRSVRRKYRVEYQRLREEQKYRAYLPKKKS